MTKDPQQEDSQSSSERIKQEIEKALIGWGPPGLGTLLTIDFFNKRQPKEAVISLVATLLSIFLAKIFNKLDPRLDLLTTWIVGNLENAILQFASKFQVKYYSFITNTYQPYRTYGQKAAPFTSDLDKVFVPLRVSMESPERARHGVLNSRTYGEDRKTEAIEDDQKIWGFLAAARRCIVVLGAPGSGKTTLLQHIALTYASNSQRRYHQKLPKLIPVILFLRDVRETILQANPPNLEELISCQRNIQELAPPPEWFKSRLRAGKLLIMLDGLDEVANDSQRQQVISWVEKQVGKYYANYFVLTSRPIGYRNAQLKQASIVLEVRSFNMKEIEAFIRSWYFQKELMSQPGQKQVRIQKLATKRADDLINRIKDNSPLSAMALNPLLLTMIATVHCYRGALPGKRVELYAEICDVLLGENRLTDSEFDSLSSLQKRSVLGALALKLTQQEVRGFSRYEGVLFVQDKLALLSNTRTRPEEFLERIEETSGLLVEREIGVYEFAHKSFQEYLTATEVKEIGQERLLIEKVEHSWWSEVIRLYSAQSDATNIIVAAMRKSEITSLTLAYDCMEEGLKVDPRIREYLNKLLEKGLTSENLEIASFAAEVKISRRLNKLLRLEDNIEIDMSYLSCAEYQVFLEEKIKERQQQYKPSHWKNNRFPPGTASEPITGISSSEAEMFCQWLTTRRYSLPGSSYRLPLLSEAQENLTESMRFGCWCTLWR